MERTAWNIRDEAILTELTQLIQITDQEKNLLRQLEPIAHSIVPDLTAAFYGRLFSHPNTTEYLQGVPSDRLYSMAAQWFVDLFSGHYDTEYAKTRLAIGKTHVRIGLPIRYPLAMFDALDSFAAQVAAHSPQPEQALSALRKLMAVDLAIFTQAYEDTQLEKLSETLGNERLARRVLLGEV